MKQLFMQLLNKGNFILFIFPLCATSNRERLLIKGDLYSKKYGNQNLKSKNGLISHVSDVICKDALCFASVYLPTWIACLLHRHET